jgi:hypothetical protein
MAQLETAFELEGLADVMVGSEAVEPGDGWPYETLIPLFADDRLSTKEVGKGIVAAYDEYYKNRQETIATQSAFDLNLVGNVVDALNSFLAKVDGSLTRIWPSLTRTMYFSESYSDLGDMRRGSDALLSVDMANAIENLVGVVPELKSTPEYKAFRNALKNFVLDSRNSPRHRKSQGVSLYAPFRRDLFNKGYQETRFARKSRWPKTLGSLYAIQEKNPARPVIKGVETISLLRQKTVSEVIQLGQDGFAFEFDGKNLLWAFAYLGVRDEEKKQTLIFQKSILRKAPKEEELTIEKKGREEMLESYTHADGVHMVGFRYDGTRRVISNGEKAFVATTDESDVGDIEAHIITVPAIYEHPKVGKYFATIYFNWLWNAVGVTLEVPQRDGSYVYAHIDPQPDATIHLLLESLSDEGKKSYMVSGTLPWKNGLFLSVDLVPPDKYEVILALESLTGMSNMARHRFSVAARDDDLLKGVANAPEELLPENFFGEWEFLDAQSWFKEGRMESIGAFAKYEPHPRYKNLLKKTLYKPKGKPLFPGLDAVEVIQRQGLPHLRQYVFDEGGIPRADYGYRMSFPVFDFKDGQYFLLEMDLATGELGVMVKRTGPTPKLSIPQGQAPSTGGIQEGIPPEGSVPSVLAGVWQSADGSAVNFRGNQWSYYEGGQKADGGVFGIQGYRLFAKSQHSGEVTVYLFQVLGNQLLLQDPYGEIYQFFRTR